MKSRKKGKMAMLRLGLATPKASTEASLNRQETVHGRHISTSSSNDAPGAGSHKVTKGGPLWGPD